MAIVYAMGDGLEASRMANLAVAVHRNSRRSGGDVAQMLRAMDDVAASVFGPEKFITGQLATLETVSGRLRYINASHPHPILLRGHGVVQVNFTTCLPTGMGDVPTDSADIPLEPGDTMLFFSDGVTEAPVAPEGELFVVTDWPKCWYAPPQGETIAETARKLCHAVLDYQHGTLQDDVIVLLLSWIGHHHHHPALPDSPTLPLPTTCDLASRTPFRLSFRRVGGRPANGPRRNTTTPSRRAGAVNSPVTSAGAEVFVTRVDGPTGRRSGRGRRLGSPGQVAGPPWLVRAAP